MDTNKLEPYHPIPRVVDPMGRSWAQPNRDLITVTDTHATMSREVFNNLKDYSRSYPSGVYAGKMWRREDGTTWFLCWYSDTPGQPDMCTINFRAILLQDVLDLIMPNKKVVEV